MLFQNITGGVIHRADGEFEHFLPLHLDAVAVADDGIDRRGRIAAPARNVEKIDALAVGAETGADQADVRLRVRADDDRAGAVAEEHAGGTILTSVNGVKFFDPDTHCYAITAGTG